MRRVIWSPRSIAMLEEYGQYLKLSGGDYVARQAIKDIASRIEQQARPPLAARPSRWKGLHEFSLLRWRKIAVLRVTEEMIEVVSLYDARQDLSMVDPMQDETNSDA